MLHEAYQSVELQKFHLHTWPIGTAYAKKIPLLFMSKDMEYFGLMLVYVDQLPTLCR